MSWALLDTHLQITWKKMGKCLKLLLSPRVRTVIVIIITAFWIMCLFPFLFNVSIPQIGHMPWRVWLNNRKLQNKILCKWWEKKEKAYHNFLKYNFIMKIEEEKLKIGPGNVNIRLGFHNVCFFNCTAHEGTHKHSCELTWKPYLLNSLKSMFFPFAGLFHNKRWGRRSFPILLLFTLNYSRTFTE